MDGCLLVACRPGRVVGALTLPIRLRKVLSRSLEVGNCDAGLFLRSLRTPLLPAVAGPDMAPATESWLFAQGAAILIAGNKKCVALAMEVGGRCRCWAAQAAQAAHLPHQAGAARCQWRCQALRQFGPAALSAPRPASP